VHAHHGFPPTRLWDYLFLFPMFLALMFKVKTLHMPIHPWIMQSEDQDSPMMIGFVGDEMTLKTIPLVCDPMVTSSLLVSCIANLEKKHGSLIIFTNSNVVFFTKVNLCCCTNSLLMKHASAPIFIVMDLLHFIMIGNKKQGIGFKYKLRPF